MAILASMSPVLPPCVAATNFDAAKVGLPESSSSSSAAGSFQLAPFGTVSHCSSLKVLHKCSLSPIPVSPEIPPPVTPLKAGSTDSMKPLSPIC